VLDYIEEICTNHLVQWRGATVIDKGKAHKPLSCQAGHANLHDRLRDRSLPLIARDVDHGRK